jgi:CBS-domain-containing membrane protein
VTLGEVCNREVIITTPDMSVMEAATLMKSCHVGDVVVVEERGAQRVPVGILTDRDIALTLVDRAVRLPYLRVNDVMTRELVTGSESENLFDVVKKMQSHGIRRLPVVNAKGSLEGIVTFDDLIELLSEELSDLAKLLAAEQKRERLHRPDA